MQRRLRLESLETRIVMDHSPMATQLIYELNRARTDPERYGIERGIAGDLTSIPTSFPLAFNASLRQSAESHVTEMTLANYLNHRSAVDGRWPNQMARDSGYPLPSSFPSDANFIEAIAGGTSLDNPAKVVEGWLYDSAIGNQANRSLIAGIGQPFANNREAGSGYSKNESSDLDHYWAVHAAYSEVGELFLTGLVYDDIDLDERYDAGEGVSDVIIQAGPWSTKSGLNGEWSLRVSGGRLNVSASGSGFNAPMTSTVAVITDNVEIDFRVNRSIQVNFQSRSDWTNPKIAEDVNADGFVTPIDALILINRLNEVGSHALPILTGNTMPPPYYDSSGDANLSPLDALVVINYLNLRSSRR